MDQQATIPSRYDDRVQTSNQSPSDAITLGSIEPGVLPLVTALNAVVGVTTIASYQGHGERATLFRRANIESAPYVLFRADVDFVRQFQKNIRFFGARKIAFNWDINAYFYPPDFDELVWVIELRDGRMPNAWDREAIDMDLNEIANIVLSFHVERQRKTEWS